MLQTSDASRGSGDGICGNADSSGGGGGGGEDDGFGDNDVDMVDGGDSD